MLVKTTLGMLVELEHSHATRCYTMNLTHLMLILGPCCMRLTGCWRWVPPPGQRIVVDRPCEVCIVDHRGSLSGANHWTGLRALLEEILEEIARDGLWTRHTCSLCQQLIYAGGRWRWIRTVITDGLTALKFAKCSVYGCQSPLPAGEGIR